MARQQLALATLEDEFRRATSTCTRRQTEQQQRRQQREEVAAAAEDARQQAVSLAAALQPVPAQPADAEAVRALLAEATSRQDAAVANRRRLVELDEKLAALREKYLQTGEAATAAQREIPRLQERQAATEAALRELVDGLVYWREQADIFQGTIQDILRPHGLALPAQPPYDGILATLEERAEFYEAQVGTQTALGKTLQAKTIQQQARTAALAQQATELAAIDDEIVRGLYHWQDAPDGVPQDPVHSWGRRHDEYTAEDLAGGRTA